MLPSSATTTTTTSLSPETRELLPLIDTEALTSKAIALMEIELVLFASTIRSPLATFEPLSVNCASLVSDDKGVTLMFIEYSATLPFSAKTLIETGLLPSCKLFVEPTRTVANSSTAVAVTKTDFVLGATENVSPSVTRNPFTVI